MTQKEAFKNASDAIQRLKTDLLIALEPFILASIKLLRKLLRSDVD